MGGSAYGPANARIYYPVHRLPGEYGAGLQEGRLAVQRDGHLLQERKEADGAVERGHSLADGLGVLV